MPFGANSNEDENLDKGDKFQCSTQCMCEDSTARDIVNSYPPAIKIYNKAIECLKYRLGRDELLIKWKSVLVAF